MTKFVFTLIVLALLAALAVLISPSSDLLGPRTEAGVDPIYESGKVEVANASEAFLKTASGEARTMSRLVPKASASADGELASSASSATQLAKPAPSAPSVPNQRQRRLLSIAGTVQEAQGYPLANIAVVAEPMAPSNAAANREPIDSEVEFSAWTNSDGSFRFYDLDDGEYRIKVPPLEGFFPTETQVRTGEMSAMLVVEQLRTVQVFGIVTDGEGEPIEGVRILAGPPTRTNYSGPNGHWDITLSVKGNNRPPAIHFRGKGFRDREIRLESGQLENQLDFQLDVAMEPLGELTTLKGLIVDEESRPIAGKVVNIRSTRTNTSFRAQSNPEGEYRVDGIEAGEGYTLSVRPGSDFLDYQRTGLEVPRDGLVLDIILEPVKRGQLSGFLIDSTGNPVSGFAMTLWSNEATGQSAQVLSDRAGFFLVEDFPEGSAVLKTNSYPLYEIQGLLVSREPEDPVELVLDMGNHSLSGQVTNEFGNVIAAAEISLNWQLGDRFLSSHSGRKTIADHNGYFEFEGLGAGVHTLRVNSPGHRMKEVSVNSALTDNNVQIRLEEDS